MRCLMGFAPWVVFSSLLSRAWPISRSGSQLVNQHSGLPAPSRVSTRQTAGRRSTTSSKPIPWPVAFVQLWLIGPYGLGPRQIFCCCAQKVLAKRNSSGSSWAKNPRALAGRLRRAQTFLRTLGIEVTFSREGRTGSRMIRGEHEDRRLRQQRQSHQNRPRQWVSATNRRKSRPPFLPTRLTVLTQTSSYFTRHTILHTRRRDSRSGTGKADGGREVLQAK